MKPALLKAKQAQAAADTASAVASVDARLARIEAKLDGLLDGLLARPAAVAPETPRPAPGRKDSPRG